MIDYKYKTFVKLVEMKNYTKAALELGLTQPAVSSQIKQLEQKYGSKLIVATSKEFELSDIGKKVYDYALLMINNETKFEASLKNNIDVYRVGATLSIADYYLSKIIRDNIFNDSYQCNIYVDNTQELTKKLIKGELDFAFVEGYFNHEQFDYQLLCKERFIAVARDGHSLQNKTLTMEEIIEYPLIIREKGSGTRSILESYLDQQAFQINSFKAHVEIGSFSLIKQLILNSEAITFLYRGVVVEEVKQGKLIELNINNFDMSKEMHVIYLKDSIDKLKYEDLFKRMIKCYP